MEWIELCVMTPGNADTSDEEEIEIKRKSSTQKEVISSLRQKQILEYQKKLTKEERQRRYALRHSNGDDKKAVVDDTYSQNDSDNASPRKKKRVSFELAELAKKHAVESLDNCNQQDESTSQVSSNGGTRDQDFRDIHSKPES